MSGRYILEAVQRATTIASDVSGQSEKQKNTSTDKQQTIMKKQIKITAIAKNGKCLNIGFKNEQMAGEYADAMTARGYVVVKQYR
jgi:hypothetical protein